VHRQFLNELLSFIGKRLQRFQDRQPTAVDGMELSDSERPDGGSFCLDRFKQLPAGCFLLAQ
jgi:hypothetical protein